MGKTVSSAIEISSLGLIDDPLGYDAAEDAADEAKHQASLTRKEGQTSRELNIQRFSEAEDRMSPFIESEAAAKNQMMVEMGLAPGEAGTAYMDTPGYQSVMDESLKAAEQSAVSSGATTYGGRRLKAAGEVGAGVQQSYYNNYMNMLSSASQPSATTNISSLGVGQGATLASQSAANRQAVGNYMAQASNIELGHNADVTGMLVETGTGAAKAAAGYI